jgi:hypothetical protein
MANLSFKLDQLLTLPIPFLIIIFRHGSQKALLKAKLGGGCVRWQQQKRKCLTMMGKSWRVRDANKAHWFGVFFEIFTQKKREPGDAEEDGTCRSQSTTTTSDVTTGTYFHRDENQIQSQLSGNYRTSSKRKRAA